MYHHQYIVRADMDRYHITVVLWYHAIVI
jgi:hypothetical protein